METCTQKKLSKVQVVNTVCNIKEKYILETWPGIQDYMNHPRWSECIFCQEIEGHPCPDSSFMIPESLYNEINKRL